MDVEAVKQRQMHVWSMGDYSVLSRQLAPAAQELCDACAVSAGQEVLDVAAGDGNFALACAREGASVVACDLAPGMVERGRARSEAGGYEVEWVTADAEELPFEDARFDCAGSVFGSMLAPRPELAAAELLRVVRPGGVAGLTAWTPDGFMAELFAVGRRFAPPQEGMPLSEEWGDEAIARARLEPLGARVELEPRTVEWRAESPEAFAQQMLDSAPTMAAARQALPPERFAELAAELKELVVTRNAAGDGSLRLEADYVLILARRRG